MPEAYGSVVIVLSKEITDEFMVCGEVISWELMTKLFKYAGIESTEYSEDMLSLLNKNEDFHHEGMEIKDNSVNVNIFGSDWMYVAKNLIQQGKGIQLYGRISHECGGEEFYVLNADGKSYLEVIDYETDYNVKRKNEITSKWISCIPQSVLTSFPDAFTSEGYEEQDNDEEYEHEDEEQDNDEDEEQDVLAQGMLIISTQEGMKEKDIKLLIEKIEKKSDVFPLNYCALTEEKEQTLIEFNVPHLDGLIIIESLFLTLEKKGVNFARAFVANKDTPSATLSFIENGEYLESNINIDMVEVWNDSEEDEIKELDEEDINLLKNPRKYFLNDLTDWEKGITPELLGLNTLDILKLSINNVIKECESIQKS